MRELTNTTVVCGKHPDLADLHQAGVSVVQLDEDVRLGQRLFRLADRGGEEADVGRAPNRANPRPGRQLRDALRPDFKHLRSQSVNKTTPLGFLFAD